MQADTLTCHWCGRTVPVSAPAGLCSRCLFERMAAGGDIPARPGVPSHTNGDGLPQLEEYELLAELARGGMGVVFKARQKNLSRIVALKMILAGSFASGPAVDRFLREAEAVASLNHPNIVPIYELGEHEGRLFYSMRFAEKGNLAENLDLFAVDDRRIAQLLVKLARAAHFAHQRGVIHRDLKPGNILITAEDEPQIADFGLARLLEQSSELTGADGLVGSPSYMPPEQATGGQITTSSDVYSLGAILYFVLTGQPPFKASSPMETVRQLQEDEAVPPTQINARVNHELATICLKCLRKDSAARYHSAAALADDLDRWLEGVPILARKTGRLERASKWVRRHPAMAVALAASLTLIAGFAILITVNGQHLKLERDDAVRERDRAESTATRLQLERAEDYLAAERPDFALPILAAVIRRTPDNALAVTRLVSALTESRALFPSSEPLAHPEGVSCAEFSKDGQWIVTGCLDGIPRVWETLTGRIVNALPRHGLRVSAVAFSPDARLLLTASHDGTARLWDWRKGQVISPLLRHDSAIIIACFNSDGSAAATAGLDQAVRLWDGFTGAPLGVALVHPDQVHHIAFAPAGRMLATACRDGSLRLWDTSSGTLLRRIEAHQSAINFVAFSPDSEALITSSDDHTVKRWRTASGEPQGAPLNHAGPAIFARFNSDGRKVLSGTLNEGTRVWSLGEPLAPPTILRHDDWLRDLRLSEDGTMVLTASADHTARIWSIETGDLLFEPLRHPRQLYSARFQPKGSTVLTVCDNRAVFLWRLRAPTLEAPALPHGGAVNFVQFSTDSSKVVTTSQQGVVKVWNHYTGELLSSAFRHKAEVLAAMFSPDGKHVASGSRDGEVHVRGTSINTPEARIFAHDGTVESLEFSPDGNALATVGGNAAHVWRWRTGAEICPPMRGHAMRTVHFSPNGERLVTADSDGVARVWNAQTGQPVTAPMSHGNFLYDAIFSPDGSLVATASWDTTARLWNSETGQPITAPLTHGGQVRRIAFSPDSRSLATACLDGSARIWDARKGTPLTSMLRHKGKVISANFSPDGTKLLTAAVDGSVRLWDTATGQPLTGFLHHSAEVFYAEFSPDGQRFASACADGTARIWEIIGLALPAPDWLVPLGEAVAGQRLMTSGAAEIVPPAELLDLVKKLKEKPNGNPWTAWTARLLLDHARTNRVIYLPSQ